MEYSRQKEKYTGPERRRFPRLRACIVEYSKIGQKKSKQLAFTENISAGGICIFVSDDFEINASLELNIFISYCSYPLKAKGRIIWRNSSLFLDRIGEKNYDIGIEFTEINELDRLAIGEYIKTYSPSHQ